MLLASVNGRLIATPYGPHPQSNLYDFHGSMLRYTRVGRGAGSGVIQTNDYIVFVWWIEGTPRLIESPYGEEEETPNVFAAISCSVPPKGAGVAGQYGPSMSQ
jgi:hypothetical protein